MKQLSLATLFLFLALPAYAAKILYFGDSHSVATSGPFGIKMNELLRALPDAQVYTHARCGSVMSWWYNGHATTCGYYDQNPTGRFVPRLPSGGNWPTNAPTPKIIPLISSIKPDLIVVEMGGNYTHYFNETLPCIAVAKKEVSKFIEDVKAIKEKEKLKTDCVWIGMPSRRMPDMIKHPDEYALKKARIDGINQAIKEAVEPFCEFVDSLPLTAYPEATGNRKVDGDGTHYSKSFKYNTPNDKNKDGKVIAYYWAEKAFETVKTHYEKIKK